MYSSLAHQFSFTLVSNHFWGYAKVQTEKEKGNMLKGWTLPSHERASEDLPAILSRHTLQFLRNSSSVLFLSLIKGEQDVEYRNPLYEAVIILRLCKIKKEESHTAHSFGEIRQLILVLRSSHASILSKYRYISPSQKHIIFYEFSNIFSFAAQHSVFLNSKRMSYSQTASLHYRESLSLVCLVTFVTPLSPSFNDLFFSHISRSKCLSPPLLSIWLH